MPKIFVSYRRSDSMVETGRIVDRLIAQFGQKSVFMDVDSIPFGVNFRQHIQSELAQTDVLVAVVGTNWLGNGEAGRHRICDDQDLVRIEIETALQQKHSIIPVLVGGASMPKPDALPESLREFVFFNAVQIDFGRDFHSHVGRLIDACA